MSRSCEEDPAFDYILTLFLEATAQPLTVLPTHRVLRGLGDDGVASLLAGLDELFDVRGGIPPPTSSDIRLDRPATEGPVGSASGRDPAGPLRPGGMRSRSIFRKVGMPSEVST